MWRVIALSILLAEALSGRLTGDHICYEETSNTINITEYFIRNATVRNYQWCMHIPPRCSIYTTKIINDTRVVQKEVAEISEKCCEGFEEDKETSTCTPACPRCVNGKCKEGQCVCSTGFKGEFCDSACDLMEWGDNCKFRCRCQRGTCDPLTGSCECPSGWTGTKCQVPCQTGSYGKNCLENCDCKSNEFCHHVTGECEPPTPLTTKPSEDDIVFTETETQRTTTIENVESTTTIQSTVGISKKTQIETEVPIKKTTKSYSFDKDKNNKSASIPVKNNGKFITNKNEILILNATSTGTTTNVSTEETTIGHQDQDHDKHSQDPTKVAITSASVNELMTGESGKEVAKKSPHSNSKATSPPIEITKSSKAKVNEKEVSVTSTGSSGLQEENYLNDEARKETVNQPPINKNDLVNGASAATAVAIAIILLSVAIVAANRCRRKRNRGKEETETNKGISTVSVYTHSIFHTPLPEPPTFENPVFLTPVLESPPPSNNEGQRFEARVVCSMNFPNYPNKDPREYLYDHPPSTGSYRAASIPEPPDIDMQSLPHVEPVYDEIPSGAAPTPITEPPPSYKSSLYMNTCGKTRL